VAEVLRVLVFGVSTGAVVLFVVLFVAGYVYPPIERFFQRLERRRG
jgi:hypothetical protein